MTRIDGSGDPIDEARIRDHLGEMVRGTVEETLNAMLDAEADQLCGAGRYERSQAAGHPSWQLRTNAADQRRRSKPQGTKAAVPDLRDRDHRAVPPPGELGRGSADRDVSGGRLGATRGGHHRSPVGHAGEPEHGVEPQQEDLRQDRGLAEPPHRRRASVSLSRWHRDEADVGWRGRNVSLLVASAVNSEGFREILGICEGAKEDKSGWSAFLRHLVDRGLKGVQLIISDACRGLMESAAEYLPDARWQRCMVHFYRYVFSHVPATRVREVSHMLKASMPRRTATRLTAKRGRLSKTCGPPG